jgi:predicted secreted protein
MHNNNPDIVEVTCYKSSHLKSPGTCYEYRRHCRRRHVIEKLTCFLHGTAEEMALNNNHSLVIGIISSTCNFHKLGKIKERFYKFYNFISVIRKSQ